MSRSLLVVMVCLGASVAPTPAQVMPKSDGGCSVSATGLMSCSWLSAVTDCARAPNLCEGGTIPPRESGLYVSRFSLADDAPLTLPLAPYDAIVVSLDEGTLLNESAGPPGVRINAYKGSVLLVRKDDHIRLRNKSGHELKVVVIENR